MHTAPVSAAPRSYLDRGNPPGVLAFAHRGGALHPANLHLENTLQAFRNAYALGYRHLETDVHLTKDGVLLALHDEVLDRVTDATGAIADLTYAEIVTARIAGKHHIPTLAELFDALPEARFNIDLKSDGCAEPLWRLIQERRAHERVLVGSFSSARLREFRALSGGSVPTSAGPGEVALFRLCPSGRLASWLVSGAVEALQIPVRSKRIPLATRAMIRRAHRAGVQVHVWTVDEPRLMGELIDRGVDGLISDRTDLLKEVLTQRGLWRETDEQLDS